MYHSLVIKGLMIEITAQKWFEFLSNLIWTRTILRHIHLTQLCAPGPSWWATACRTWLWCPTRRTCPPAGGRGRRSAGRRAGGQINSFVEISTEFLVLQGEPHYYKNSVEKSVEKSVEISTKLLNCAPGWAGTGSAPRQTGARRSSRSARSRQASAQPGSPAAERKGHEQVSFSVSEYGRVDNDWLRSDFWNRLSSA